MAGQSVAVIGNGSIGHDIPEVFAGADWRVTLIGRNAESLEGCARQNWSEPSDVRSPWAGQRSAARNGVLAGHDDDAARGDGWCRSRDRGLTRGHGAEAQAAPRRTDPLAQADRASRGTPGRS
jgi:hypothetical protein